MTIQKLAVPEGALFFHDGSRYRAAQHLPLDHFAIFHPGGLPEGNPAQPPKVYRSVDGGQTYLQLAVGPEWSPVGTERGWIPVEVIRVPHNVHATMTVGKVNRRVSEPAGVVPSSTATSGEPAVVREMVFSWSGTIDGAMTCKQIPAPAEINVVGHVDAAVVLAGDELHLIRFVRIPEDLSKPLEGYGPALFVGPPDHMTRVPVDSAAYVGDKRNPRNGTFEVYAAQAGDGRPQEVMAVVIDQGSPVSARFVGYHLGDPSFQIPPKLAFTSEEPIRLASATATFVADPTRRRDPHPTPAQLLDPPGGDERSAAGGQHGTRDKPGNRDYRSQPRRPTPGIFTG